MIVPIFCFTTTIHLIHICILWRNKVVLFVTNWIFALAWMYRKLRFILWNNYFNYLVSSWRNFESGLNWFVLCGFSIRILKYKNRSRSNQSGHKHCLMFLYFKDSWTTLFLFIYDISNLTRQQIETLTHSESLRHKVYLEKTIYIRVSISRWNY